MVTDVMHDAPVAIPERPFGRIVRSVLGYALLTAAMSCTPLMLLLPVAIFFCAIRNGRVTTWLTFILGVALTLGMVRLTTPPKDLNLEIAMLASVVLGIGLPALIVSPLLERNGSFGSLVTGGLGVSTAGLTLAEFGARSL